MTSGPRITIHMVSSLDGMIAKKDNSVSWFETTNFFEKGAAEPDIPAFLKTIDCYIMGSRTYEHALELACPRNTYSVRKFLTGLASAARMTWKPIVTSARKSAAPPEIKNTHPSTAVR